MEIEIHSTAIVADGVELGAGCTVGPYAIIESGAKIGEESEISAGCHIFGGVTMGKRNRLMRAASLGGEPQSLGYRGQTTRLVIGDDNWFGENVVIHRGTVATGETTIGHHLYMMNGAHIGHDSRIGNHVTMAPGVKIGGQAEVRDRANLGAGAGVHQHARVGELVMVGAMARVTQDVLPFTTVADDGILFGLNSIGIRRAEFCPNQLGQLKTMYRKFCLKREPLASFREWLAAQPQDLFQETWAEFLSTESKRGYARGRNRSHRALAAG